MQSDWKYDEKFKLKKKVSWEGWRYFNSILELRFLDEIDEVYVLVWFFSPPKLRNDNLCSFLCELFHVTRN